MLTLLAKVKTPRHAGKKPGNNLGGVIPSVSSGPASEPLPVEQKKQDTAKMLLGVGSECKAYIVVNGSIVPLVKRMQNSLLKITESIPELVLDQKNLQETLSYIKSNLEKLLEIQNEELAKEQIPDDLLRKAALKTAHPDLVKYADEHFRLLELWKQQCAKFIKEINTKISNREAVNNWKWNKEQKSEQDEVGFLVLNSELVQSRQTSAMPLYVLKEEHAPPDEEAKKSTQEYLGSFKGFDWIDVAVNSVVRNAEYHLRERRPDYDISEDNTALYPFDPQDIENQYSKTPKEQHIENLQKGNLYIGEVGHPTHMHPYLMGKDKYTPSNDYLCNIIDARGQGLVIASKILGVESVCKNKKYIQKLDGFEGDFAATRDEDVVSSIVTPENIRKQYAAKKDIYNLKAIRQDVRDKIKAEFSLPVLGLDDSLLSKVADSTADFLLRMIEFDFSNVDKDISTVLGKSKVPTAREQVQFFSKLKVAKDLVSKIKHEDSSEEHKSSLKEGLKEVLEETISESAARKTVSNIAFKYSKKDVKASLVCVKSTDINMKYDVYRILFGDRDPKDIRLSWKDKIVAQICKLKKEITKKGYNPVCGFKLDAIMSALSCDAQAKEELSRPSSSRFSFSCLGLFPQKKSYAKDVTTRRNVMDFSKTKTQAAIECANKLRNESDTFMYDKSTVGVVAAATVQAHAASAAAVAAAAAVSSANAATVAASNAIVAATAAASASAASEAIAAAVASITTISSTSKQNKKTPSAQELEELINKIETTHEELAKYDDICAQSIKNELQKKISTENATSTLRGSYAEAQAVLKKANSFIKNYAVDVEDIFDADSDYEYSPADERDDIDSSSDLDPDSDSDTGDDFDYDSDSDLDGCAPLSSRGLPSPPSLGSTVVSAC